MEEGLGLRVVLLLVEMDGIEDWSVSERLSLCRPVGTMIGTGTVAVTFSSPSPFLFIFDKDGLLAKEKEI